MFKKRNIDWNPVVVKELRSRMRGGRPFATLTGVLILIVAASYGIYQATLAGAQYTSTPISPMVGQMLFIGLVFLELFIIAVVTPAATASEISSEKEKQTYEMLLTTPLNPASILWGKFIASLSYIFILIFAAIPLASVVFIYGGVSAREMIKALICLIFIAIFFAAIGIFFSALVSRTTLATILTYLVIFGLLFGPIFAGILISALNQQGDPPRWILNLSPLMVLASAISPSVNTNSLTSSLYMLGSPVFWILGSPPISTTSIPRPAYHFILPIYMMVTLLLYMISTRLVRPIRRWRIGWPETVVGILVVLGLWSIVSLAFMATADRYENAVIPPTSTPLPVGLPPAPTILSPSPPEDETPVNPGTDSTETPQAFGLLIHLQCEDCIIAL